MQVNESVNVSNFFMVGNQTGKGSRTSADKSEQTDFASFLKSSTDSSGKNNTDVKQQSDVKAVSSKDTSLKNTSSKETSVKDKTVEKSAEDVRQENVKEENVQNTDLEVEKEPLYDEIIATEQIETTEILENVVEESDTDLSLEELDALLETIGNILQQVMEHFDLAVEDLSKKLDEFGMEAEDLLSEDGLKSFFLSMNSADVSDLLVDEGLNQDWNQFFDDLKEEIVQDGVSLEDLSDYAKGQNEKNLLDYMPHVDSHMEENLVKTGVAKQPDGGQDVDMDMDIPIDLKEPSVTVSNENPIRKDGQDTSDSEMSGKQDTYTFKEEVHNTEKNSVTDKRDLHFEHPVLQAVEQALDNVQDVSFVEEVPVSGKEVIDQIVEQVKLNMNQDTTSLEMQLYPEHLGKIQINVVSKDGVLTARIMAETEAAKQAIEGGLTSLKESMEQQNLKVDAIEVMVSTTGFESNNEEQSLYERKQSSNSGKKSGLSELQEDEDEKEAAELEKMKYAGSSVSYTA
ncbi:MAG: flagellar hook-length control protein FliK [Lachnospiraceae bacterium]|nr:flagellar hook-length control protein FliK [Lachnospiraceae bacterium]